MQVISNCLVLLLATCIAWYRPGLSFRFGRLRIESIGKKLGTLKELHRETRLHAIETPPKRPISDLLTVGPNFGGKESNIVIIAGFEAFNIQLYRKAAEALREKVPAVPVYVFTDADIAERPDEVEAALKGAKVVFCSLIFDFLQVQWIRSRINHVPTRFMFESALELMSETRVGEFQMGSGGRMGGGPPAPVKAILKQFGSGREEDRMTGYLNFLKVGPKLLKWVPGKKVKDLRTWLTVYAYWSQGALQNVVSMLYTIINDLELLPPGSTAPVIAEDETSTEAAKASSSVAAPQPAPIVEHPQQGVFHPRLLGRPEGDYMTSPREYAEWYERTHSWVTEDTPRVGILLYRKHVVTEQGYIPNMITLLESQGMMPIPVFINGVEGHTVVRDLFTTEHEQEQRRRGFTGGGGGWQLSTECTKVDAVVNTIGFPLVGGPAGSMEGGRQIEVAKEILSAKNVPYIVAAPLLIQDTTSWERSGVQGLQTVVLYSLPELDGAIETMVLGGLVGGENIVVIPERVRRLSDRLKAWIRLRKMDPVNRQVAMMVYGFPPNVGAVATAALLNVGNSLRNVLLQLSDQGYFLGKGVGALASRDYGEKLVSALRVIAQDNVFAGGSATADKIARVQKKIDEVVGAVSDIKVRLQEVPYDELKAWLGKDATRRMEKQWGELERFSGLGTSGAPGKFLVAGLQIGNVFLGVQPLLGVEGDPMRLLFERDLTPHPQYAAFYKWLQNSLKPDCIVHFGMHGTVEWLPGSPLGTTADSWPDMLLGNAPNIYLYACNNPSESILAKRRGFATVVSHNVPPYARAGLYKELAAMRDLLSELRSTEGSDVSSESSMPGMAGMPGMAKNKNKNPAVNTKRSNDVIPMIVAQAEKTGVFDDLPYTGKFADPPDLHAASSSTSGASGVIDGGISAQIKTGGRLSSDRVAKILEGPEADTFVEEFGDYSLKLFNYLAELEQRLFSEGLHEIGAALNPNQIVGYLDAVFDGSGLTNATLSTIAEEAIAGSSISSIMLKAQNIQQKSDSNSGTASSPLWSQSQSQSGVDWSDAFTDEDKFGFRLLREEGLGDFLQFQWLRLRRDWGSNAAEQQINDMIAVGLSSSAKSNKDGAAAGGGAAGEIFKAVQLAQLLASNPKEEIGSLIRGIGGEFVLPAPGGDVIRDGSSVLPTGRNIHALDPYRIPSAVAMSRGSTAARLILEGHRRSGALGDTLGPYPETVAVTLWGLDTIKTKGESIGILLALVGAEPVREATGRIVGFDLIPLETLGRPRVDVLASLSGIFRDSFGNVLDLLDDLFERASNVDEPLDMNFIKKHTEELRAKGVERPFSRLFSNPPGDFGSMVNEQVGSGDWGSGEDLGNTWANRNGFSYGRQSSSVGPQGGSSSSSASGTTSGTAGASNAAAQGVASGTGNGKPGAENGQFRPEVLSKLLSTTDRVVQEIDSVEYGLTDIQEYYANTGALKKAAENKRGGKRVGISVVETFDKNVRPRELEETLRMEYRSKLLNPKWAEAMASQGAGGAYEISGRMTAMIGWAATTDFAEKWVFDGAAERYVLDEEMARKLRQNNPEAFRNIIKRMLEAKGRGFWDPSDDVVEKLQEAFEDVEDMIEGV